MKFPFSLITLLFVAACGVQTQTSSGADYVASRSGHIDKSIAEIAAIEPNLHFPAKFGVARIVNGQITSPTGKEAEQLAAFAEQNKDLGSFVAISPLVVAMTTPTQTPGRYNDIIQALRNGAARQHVDYLLIYEMGARDTTSNTPLAIADVTIIGGFLLPTRHIKTAGIGQAALIDVRNGYPYGTASAIHDLSSFGRSFDQGRRNSQKRADKALSEVSKKLFIEINTMLAELRTATTK